MVSGIGVTIPKDLIPKRDAAAEEWRRKYTIMADGWDNDRHVKYSMISHIEGYNQGVMDALESDVVKGMREALEESPCDCGTEECEYEECQNCVALAKFDQWAKGE